MASHMHAKKREDVYIKDGIILRGSAATVAKIRRDVLDVLQDTGLDKYIGKKETANSPADKTESRENDHPTADSPTGDSSSLPQDAGVLNNVLDTEAVACVKDDAPSEGPSCQAGMKTSASDSEEQNKPEEMSNGDHKQAMTTAEVQESLHPHPSPSMPKESIIPNPVGDESEDCSLLACEESNMHPTPSYDNDENNALDECAEGEYSDSDSLLTSESGEEGSDISNQELESMETEGDTNTPPSTADGSNQTESETSTPATDGSNQTESETSTPAADGSNQTESETSTHPSAADGSNQTEGDTSTPPSAADGSNQTEHPSGPNSSSDKRYWVEVKALKKKISEKKVKRKEYEMKPRQAYATGVHIQALNKTKVGDARIVKAPHATASATGMAFTAGIASAYGTNAQFQAKASAQATGVEGKVASVDVKRVKLQAEACVGVETKGVQVQGLGFTANAKDLQTIASANAKAQGLGLQAVNANLTGSQASAKAEATCQAEVGNASVASASVTGVTEQCEAKVSAVAKGIECKAAQVSITGKKEQVMVGASAEAKGIDVKAANVNVKGIDGSTSVTATASVTGFEANIANVDVTGIGSDGFHASAEAKFGVDAFNVRAGVRGGTGVGVSTKPQVANVNLSPGMPGFKFGPALNFSPFSGGGGGSNDDGRRSGGKNSNNSGDQRNKNRGPVSSGGDGGGGSTGGSVGASGETHNSNDLSSQSESGHGGSLKTHSTGAGGAHGSGSLNRADNKANGDGTDNYGGGDSEHGSSGGSGNIGMCGGGGSTIGTHGGGGSSADGSATGGGGSTGGGDTTGGGSTTGGGGIHSATSGGGGSTTGRGGIYSATSGGGGSTTGGGGIYSAVGGGGSTTGGGGIHSATSGGGGSTTGGGGIHSATSGGGGSTTGGGGIGGVASGGGTTARMRSGGGGTIGGMYDRKGSTTGQGGSDAMGGFRRNDVGPRRTIGQYGHGGSGISGSMHSDRSMRNGSITPRAIFPRDIRSLTEKLRSMESTSKEQKQSSQEAKQRATAAAELSNLSAALSKVPAGGITGMADKKLGTKNTTAGSSDDPQEGKKGGDTESEQNQTANTKQVATGTNGLPGNGITVKEAFKGRGLPLSQSNGPVHTTPTVTKRAAGKSNTKPGSDACTNGDTATGKGTGNPLGFLDHTTSKHDSDPSLKRQQQTYGDLLGEAVGGKVRHLDHKEKEKETPGNKLSKITIPSDREAAKKWLADKLKPLKEELDSREASSGGSGQHGDSTAGNEMQSSTETKKLMAAAVEAKKPRADDQSRMAVAGGKKPLGAGAMADKSAADGNDRSRAAEKPFGANKNIHTLDCFKMGSARGVGKVKGTIFGFQD